MTNNLGVHEYTVGGMYDTWGTDFIEDLAVFNKFAGDTLVVPDTSGNVTLDAEDCQVFSMQANGSGSTIVNIRVPDAISRFHYLRNDRADGQISYRCAAGGTAVTLDPGAKRLVYSDGTNCTDLTLVSLAIASITGLQTALDAKQPLDSDLTAIAALTTTTFGRSLLTAADAAALSAVVTGFQPLDSDLTAIAALTTTTYGRALLALADAAAGRTALGLGTIAVEDEATAAQYRANTASKALSTDKVWSAAAEVTLTDAATIAVDMSTFLNAVVTLGGNRTLGQPSNTKVGQSGAIRIVQDGTGSRTLAFHSDWKFAFGADPVVSTAASATDILYYQVIAANVIVGSLVKGIA
jgi:hypothetical protein